MTEPFFSSTVTVSLFSFMRNLQRRARALEIGDGAADVDLRTVRASWRRVCLCGGAQGGSWPSTRGGEDREAGAFFAAAARASLALDALMQGQCPRPVYTYLQIG
jgi:hypothetical protein